MNVTLNGSPHTTSARTLATLVDPLPDDGAVALNGTVVPRAQLVEQALRDGDVVEVVRAVAGG